MSDRLVSVEESMKIVGVKSPTSLYALISSGELPGFIKRGRRSFLLESELQRYVAKLAARASPQPQLLPPKKRTAAQKAATHRLNHPRPIDIGVDPDEPASWHIEPVFKP